MTMAYFSQQNKAKMAPQIKAILNKYGLKGSLSVDNHSTVVLSIPAGKIDFISNFNDCAKLSHEDNCSPERTSLSVNKYAYKRHFSGTALNCLTELFNVLYDGNHDRSDIMTDYFDVGWYVSLNIGKWDKPYKCC